MAASTAAESSAKGPVSDWVPPTYNIFAAWAPTGNNNVAPTKIIALTANTHLILTIFFLLSDRMHDFVSTLKSTLLKLWPFAPPFPVFDF